MPSSLNFQGKRIYKPGVYGRIDAAQLAGRGLSTGNVAVVGEFPLMKKATPLAFSNSRSVNGLFGGDIDMSTLAKYAFAPSQDQRIPGGADRLTFVSASPTTKAAGFLLDDTGAPSVKLTSLLSGPKGNQTSVSTIANASDPKRYDITVTRSGVEESFLALGTGPVVDVEYIGSDVTSASFKANSDQWLWQFERLVGPLISDPGPGSGSIASWTPTQLPLDAAHALSLEIRHNPSPNAQPVVVTITGVNHASVPVVEDVIFALGSADETVVTSVAMFSSVTSVEIATDDGAYTGSVNVTGYMYDLDTTQYRTVQDIALRLQQDVAKGVSVTVRYPRLSQIPAFPQTTEDDKAGGVDPVSGDAASGAVTVTANRWDLVTTLNARSGFIQAVQMNVADSGTLKAPVAASAITLLGGSVASTKLSDWEDALRAIQTANIQIVVLLSDQVAHHKLLVNHCKASALSGYERDGWVGVPANTSLDSVFADHTLALNSPYTSLCAQEVRITDSLGRSVWKPSYFLALLFAAASAGTPVGTPITNKRLDILDVRQPWTLELDDNDVISKGICAITSDSLGLKALRTVTTYLEDDNPAYSERSAWESLQTSVRDLRNQLNIEIGEPTSLATRGGIEAVAARRLDGQVAEGIIKAWKNLEVLDEGDTFPIGYQAAPIEPVNFIPVTLYATRISG